MNINLVKLKIPLLFSTIILLPFVLLEFVNRRIFHEPFPFFLFFILWLLPAAFMLILLSAVQRGKAGFHSKLHLASLLVSVACLMLLAGVWLAILHDQGPCFMGVINCD